MMNECCCDGSQDQDGLNAEEGQDGINALTALEPLVGDKSHSLGPAS